MAAGLIISIISVFIVISISAAIYIQNRKQGTSYDNKLTEVVSKTNNANQYEYEKNKDQEVSLDKLRNDIQTYDKRMNSIQNDFNYIKTQQAAQVSGMQKTLGDFKSSVETTHTAINRVDGEQTSRINGISNTLDGAMGQIKGINDKVTVINGQLVNIGQKQQSQIDSLGKDASAIKTEQGALRDTIFNIKNENVARLQEQSKTINDFSTNSTTRLNTQDASIKTVTDQTNSIQSSINSINTALQSLKGLLNNYMLKNDMTPYATKIDVSSFDAKLSNYLTNTDFNTFKANLPDYPTKAEMQGLVNSFVTKPDVANITTTISTAQKALTDLSGSIDTIKTTYATKNDLLKITGDLSSGTVNISSLTVTLQGIQDNLKTLQTNLTTSNNNLTTFKTDSTNTFASKTELANLNTSLMTAINTIKSGTGSILDTLTVNKSFVSKGDAIINDIRFSKGWTGYPDNATDRSEISNDISGSKKLMIVGNKSAGAERKVGVWDRLDVHGTLGVDNSAVAGQVRGNDWVAAGANNAAWMNNSGQVRGNDWVAAGANNAAWMNSAGQVHGNDWVRAGNSLSTDNGAAYINNEGTVFGKNWMRSDTGFHVQNGSAFMQNNGTVYGKDWMRSDTGYYIQNGAAYMQNNGTVYGKDWMRSDTGYYIQNGSAYMQNNGKIKAGESYLAHENGNSYIRPQKDGGHVLIGDAWASSVQVGKGDSRITLSGNTYLNDKPLYITNSNGLITFNESENDNTHLLQDYFNVYVGIVSGKEDVYKNEKLGNIKVLNGENKLDKYILIEKFPCENTEINEYLLQHKTELMGRGIRKFNDNNWYQWGALRNISIVEENIGKDCIYVYNLTRKPDIAFIGKIGYFGGGLLMLKQKKQCDLNKIVLYLNSDKFKSNFTFSGRFKIGQRQLCNSYIPSEFINLM